MNNLEDNVTNINQNGGMNSNPNYGANTNPNLGTNTSQGYTTKKAKSSFESTVGKNIMGILASVLIFAGLTLFATAVSDYISNEVKLGVIVFVSLALFVVGLIGKNKRKNAFFMSLAGCGIGAVFISIFLAYGYFHMIEMIALYILLAIWAIAVALLGGEDATLFRIIGQIGIIVSLIFGVTQLSGSHGDERIVWTSVLVIFFILISVTYLIIDHKSMKFSYKVELISDVIATVFLYIAVAGVDQDIIMTALFVVISVYSLAILAVYSRQFVDRYSASMWTVFVFVATGITMIAAFCFYGFFGEKQIQYSIIALCYLAVVVVLNELADINKENKKAVVIAAFFVAFIFSYKLGAFSDMFGVSIITAPLVILAYRLKDKTYATLSATGTLLFAIFSSHMWGKEEFFLIYILVAVVLVAANVFMIIAKREDVYSSAQKILLYISTQMIVFSAATKLYEIIDVKENVIIDWVYIIFTILCIIASVTKFGRNWLDTDKYDDVTKVFLIIVNTIQFSFGTCLCYLENNEVYHIIILIMLAASLLINVKYISEKMGNTAAVCIFNCLRVTVFSFVLLSSYEAAGYIVSAGLILVAIGCIIYGFIKKYKPIRLYGLILSIISIVKIVLIDIDYESSVARAVTIFICGIIAFAICLVYNLLDKGLDPSEDRTVETVKKKPGVQNYYAVNNINNSSNYNSNNNANNEAVESKEVIVNNEAITNTETIDNSSAIETNITDNTEDFKETVSNKSINSVSYDNTQVIDGTKPVNMSVPIYFVQYVIPGPDGKPMAQMIPVYQGQAMSPAEFMQHPGSMSQNNMVNNGVQIKNMPINHINN